MGLIDSLFGKRDDNIFGEEQQTVVIPEHRQKAMQKKQARENARKEEEKADALEKKRQEIVYAGSKPLFQIADIFGVGGISMVKGRVLRGRIKPRSKILSEKKKFVISEVRKNNLKVQQLMQGEHGTLFLKQLKGFHHKTGDVVQIE